MHKQLLCGLSLCQPKLALLLLHLRLMRSQHRLKYAQVTLVLESDPGQQRVIIARVLLQLVVAYQNHLHLLHVVLLVHLECAAIDHLLQRWLARPDVELILVQEVVNLI